MKIQIDRESHLPLYIQLSNGLRELIRNNTYRENDVFPTENQLIEELGVSRTTVREAIKSLEKQGYIKKIQGSGTFVSNPKIAEVLPRLCSFSKLMKDNGFDIRSEVLEIDRITATQEIADKMNAPIGETILKVYRRRYVNDEPFVLSTSFLRGDILQEENFLGSIYNLIETKYHISIASGRAAIEAVAAGEKESDLLNYRVGNPLLKITWLTLDSHNNTIEMSENFYRGDRYHYVINLECENAGKNEK